MSGQFYIDKALRTTDPASAERFLLEAIRTEPDLGTPYELRGCLAVLRHDAVAAAHHFRVAYARGDRSVDTRVGFAICLAAAGQGEIGKQMREGLSAPSSFADFEDEAETLAEQIKAILATPLPPRGEAALLPGEPMPAPIVDPDAVPRTAQTTAEQLMSTRPDAIQTHPEGAAVCVVRAGPTPEVKSEPPPEPPRASVPPESAPPPSSASPSASASTARPPLADVANRTSSRGRRLPDWLEQIDREPLPRCVVSPADWLTTNAEYVSVVPSAALLNAGPLTDGGVTLEVTHDPGAPQFVFRSPVTGRLLRPEDIIRDRSEARMPDFEPVPDLLGRARIFADLIDTRRLIVALELPGPVLTAAGAPPRPLCRTMAFGATQEELLFRDIEKPGLVPVRLPRATIVRMDVFNDDQQVTFALRDGRQLHIDLRALARRHGPTHRTLLRRLAELMPPPP